METTKEKEVLIPGKSTKKAINLLKETIKERAEKQKFYRDQRKAIHNKLPREVDPREAAWKHASNREVLHIMYMAYAVMRDKSMVESGLKKFDEEWQRENFFKQVDRMIDTFQRTAADEK